MTVQGNDTPETYLDLTRVLKHVFLSLEPNFRKVAMKFEHCFSANNTDMGRVTVGIFKRKTRGAIFNQSMFFYGDERAKENAPIFVGTINEKCTYSDVVKGVQSYVASSPIKEGYDSDNSGKGEEHWPHFVRGFSLPFRNARTWINERSSGSIICCDTAQAHLETEPTVVSVTKKQESEVKERRKFSFEDFVGISLDQLMNFPKFDGGWPEYEIKNTASAPPVNQFVYFKALASILKSKKADISEFLVNLNFAGIGGVPSGMVEVAAVEDMDNNELGVINEEDVSERHKLATWLLSIPLSKVKWLRSTLSTASFTELIELLPQIGGPVMGDHPDKKILFLVHNFFRYTEAEGKRFFQELDRNGDGQVTLEDLEIAMLRRKLPRRYAHEFMRHARRHFFSKSFGWKQFLSLMKQREQTILQAYTSLCLSKSGTLQKNEILATLKNAGLPANEDNAVAMIRLLNADTEESISYGHFRNFMLLLPSDKLHEDPRNTWFEAATVVSVPPPEKIRAECVLKSALAGGLSCAFSTALMHPVDTIKTRVQASTLTFPEILSKLPELEVRGLYRGSIPAILGQFCSHGLRTGICEASKLVLVNMAPTLPDVQIQSIASFCSTFLGTAVRIPCEVLKQRLQAGLYDNVGAAFVGTWQQDGLTGFFRGTGATLVREIPFYVAGVGLYAESKKVAQQILERELGPWEALSVGAISGGLTAVLTTPLDMIKTRMMTARPGEPVALSLIALSILRHEGPLGLFKGAVPRFFWVAPLGAINFAGYELAMKVMDTPKN